MKKYISILFFCFFIYNVVAQDTILEDKLWQDYSKCLNLVERNQHEQALPYLRCLLSQIEKNEPFNVDAYLATLFLLDDCYLQKNDQYSSYELYEKAFDLVRIGKISDYNRLSVAKLYMRMGRIQVSLNSYVDALQYMSFAQNIYKNMNEYGEMYIALLSNMSAVYLANGELIKAKSNIKEAMALLEKYLDEDYNLNLKNDSRFSTLFSNYAFICALEGDTNEAIKYYMSLMKNSNPSDLAYQSSCNGLSMLLMALGRYEESIKYLENLLYLGEKLHLYVPEQDLYQNLALNYLYLGYKDKAKIYLELYNQKSIDIISEMYSKYSIMDIEDYWNSKSFELMFLNTIIAFNTQDDNVIIEAYNNTQLCKTLRLGFFNIIRKYMQNTEDSNLHLVYNEYLKLRNDLSHKKNNNIEEKELLFKILENEKYILNSIVDLNGEIRNVINEYSRLNAQLSNNEIVVECCYIPVCNNLSDTQYYYGAFVFGKNYPAPKLVLFSEVEQINNLILSLDFDEFQINEFYKPINSINIYNKIWKKLEPYLDNTSTIYYSPVGLLSYVNNDILCDSLGRYMNERFRMIRVSSANNISNLKLNDNDYKSSILYGGIEYDETIENMIKESNSYMSYTGQIIDTTSIIQLNNVRGKWGSINATSIEVEDIGKMLNEKNINVHIIKGIKASEESFKSLSDNSPDIIHLATHGFVINTYDEYTGNKVISKMTPYSVKEGYMLWSGLLMSGANNAWTGNFDLHNVEDGILTSDEISRLDLSKTKLVVLSACETGKGIIESIDGVLGLQHAFKRSGVGSIIMSLWKVPDVSTSVLMKYFYSFLLEGIERHEALKKAMEETRKIYHDPYYWAGFILLD